MKVIGCQLDIVWENKKANYAKVRSLLEAAPPERGALLLLPEMFATGFSMNVQAIQEGIPSETEAFLATLAREHGVYVMGGVVSPGAQDRGRNESVVFNPQGRLLARYCKQHPFSLGGESQHYEAGKGGATFDWQGFTTAPFICYDLRFPEIFRTAIRSGAQLLAVIANWPSKRAQHWVTLLQARAIENQAYVIGVNRCGHDPKLHYPGRSLVVDPLGEIIADAGEHESLMCADLDLEKVVQWRKDFPALRDAHFE